MEPRVGHTRDNVEASIRYIEQAAAQGASLIVLPELANSGYVFASRAEAFALSEPLADSETVRAWSEAARRLGVHLVAGIAEREDQRLYNSAVFIGPAGLIGRYRKLHLWGQENLFFEPGNL
ncbi:nitrilase-related carbon-nitrogen hydrolase, partial [Burkholderia gladioli]